MALIMVDEVQTADGTLYSPATGVNVFFAAGVKAKSISGLAVDSLGADVGVFVSTGAQISGRAGLRLGNSDAADKWIEIEHGARVSGSYVGVALTGNRFELLNSGQITGSDRGMDYSLNNAAHHGSIVNSGQIVGSNFGVSRSSIADTGTLNLLNTGLIWGDDYAIYGAARTTFRITNSGELRGTDQLGNLNDRVDNTGKIIGALRLQDGDDGYNGTSGQVTGTVFAGAGNDKLYGGKSAETLYGEAGNDILQGNGGNDILSGGADNNKLYGGTDNDTLYGNSGNDYLQGDAGNDNLYGSDGIDILYGGLGKDTLTGGAGKDTFVFKSIKDSTAASLGRDVITDFSRADAEKIDLKLIDASTKISGDQAFAFIGTQAFHKKAGELRYEIKSGDTYISGDVNGDGVPTSPSCSISALP